MGLFLLGLDSKILFVRHLPPLKDVLCIAVRIFLLNFLVMHLYFLF